MKKMLFVSVMILLLTGCVRKIDIEEYEKYLIDTYGDLNFEYVPIESCDWISGGTCTYYFTTQELDGKTFSVYGSFGIEDKRIFEDTYVKTKYDAKLKQYYNNYFKSILKNGIEIKSINIIDVASEYNIPDMPFDKYLKYIENKKIEIIFKQDIKLDKNNEYFNLKTNDKSVDYEKLEKANQELNKFIYNNYDIYNLEKEVENIIFTNKLNNIREVSINYDGCEKGVYYASCSEFIELYNK